MTPSKDLPAAGLHLSRWRKPARDTDLDYGGVAVVRLQVQRGTLQERCRLPLPSEWVLLCWIIVGDFKDSGRESVKVALRFARQLRFQAGLSAGQRRYSAPVLGEAGAEVTRALLRALPRAAAAALLDRLPADDAAEVLRESTAGAVMRSARGDPAAHLIDGSPSLVNAPAPEGTGWQGWPPPGRPPAEGALSSLITVSTPPGRRGRQTKAAVRVARC